MRKRYLCIYLISTHLRLSAALKTLAKWALKFAPLIGISERTDGLVLDISGTERLHKGERELMYKIYAELSAHKIDVKIAAAPSIGAAWAAARYDPPTFTFLDERNLKSALSALPIEALRINAESVEALKQVGIFKIDELFKLPRKSLGIRFGVFLLKRLDQALGLVDETFTPFREEPQLLVKKSFETPLGRSEDVEKVALHLLEQSFQLLNKQGKKAKRFLIRLELLLPHGERIFTSKELMLHSAAFEFSKLKGSISTFLEALALDAAVKTIYVLPKEIEALKFNQRTLNSSSELRDLERLQAELLNHLALRLSPKALNQFSLRASHVPEKSFSYSSEKQAENKNTENKKIGNKNTNVALAVPHDRPPYLFENPEPFSAIALLPDHPPARIRWRGKEYKIICALASEKITAEWWERELTSIKEPLPERHYFKIQEQDGQWLWVFRTSDLRWFVHGVWA